MGLKESLTEQEWEERGRVSEMVLSARSLNECRQARAMLLGWREKHPDDWGILDGGEMLSNATDYAELQDAERRALGFSEEIGIVRERVFIGAQRAFTLSEITEARRNLLRWRRDYPCDADKVGRALGYLDDKESVQIILADMGYEDEATSDVLHTSKNGVHDRNGAAVVPTRETVGAR